MKHKPTTNNNQKIQDLNLKRSTTLYNNSDLTESEDIQLNDLSSSLTTSSSSTPSITKMSQSHLLSPGNYDNGNENDEENFEIESDNDEYIGLYKDEGISSKIKRFFYRLWNGPIEPKDEYAPRITKLEYFEEIPDKFNGRIPLIYKRLLLVVYLIFWFGLIYTILIPYFTIPPYSNKDPKSHIYSLSCSSQSEFWNGKNTACGLNGELCPDILKHTGEKDIIIRCPALCDRGSWTYSLMPIGDQRIKYRGYFIGGGDKVQKSIDKNQITNPYRADSYPCGAAVHAGIVSPIWGGCARMSYKSGNQPFFNSTKGHYGVDNSINFNSFFKSSFFFKNLISSDDNDQFIQCTDPRIIILIINILLGIPIVYLASGAITFWVTNIVGFWTICLATDPPVNVDATDPQDFAYLISIGLERFLPTCSILYILWHFSTKRTLSEPTSPNEKVSYLSRLFLFYPLFWLGVLNNVTFDRLPVDRLTISDLKEQSGAMLAVSGIIITITTCAFIQAYKIWLSGRFQKYLLIYSIFVIGLIFLAGIPGLTLRVHHYILAMLLIPGCATRGRTALMFQGILLGLFLSGASRWGLAAIAETITSLKRDDPKGSLIPPIITDYNSSTGSLNWQNIPTNITKVSTNYEKYSSISILINDIEHLILDGSSSIDLKQVLTNTSNPIYDWVQDGLSNGLKDSKGDIPIYIRIGRKIPNTNLYSDFSNAAILKWPSGELTLPLPGLT
ncbi:hypothetical protein KGF54_004852 [Candida jiufengensis]|uniref:uncharacterized protein n=1 Tax=Candida jiufengensis TaxID=497108 RepID=UPI0022241FE0|nr:uncharacterized protein KGF54_004852 [Candida jiufengensis]KAI5951777.1 hypothetical protein KGF54_004852 [Candida jiufengensis]